MNLKIARVISPGNLHKNKEYLCLLVDFLFGEIEVLVIYLKAKEDGGFLYRKPIHSHWFKLTHPVFEYESGYCRRIYLINQEKDWFGHTLSTKEKKLLNLDME